MCVIIKIKLDANKIIKQKKKEKRKQKTKYSPLDHLEV